MKHLLLPLLFLLPLGAQIDVPTERTPVKPQAGFLRLVNKDGMLWTRDPNGVESIAGVSDPEAFREAINGLDYLDPVDYGADKTGVLPSSAAINAAINAAVAGGVVREIRLQVGDYLIDETIVMKNDSFKIRGSGRNTRLIVTDDAVSAITGLYVGDSPPDIESGPHRWTIENLSIVGPGKATSTGYGIYFENGGQVSANRVVVEDCRISGFDRGFYGNYTVNTLLDRVAFKDNNYSIYGVSNDTFTVRNCWTGYSADEVAIYSSAPGTGVLCIDGGEHGNCATLFDCTGGTLVIRDANFETVTGDYAIRTHQCELHISDTNYASISVPLVRNSGNANVAIFDNVYPRSGSAVFDGALLGYQTNVAGDFPIMRNTPLCWQRTNADFSVVTETHSYRDPLPYNQTPEIQRLELAGVPTTAVAGQAAIANNGFLIVSGRGFTFGSWTTAGSVAVTNLAKGNAYAPVLMRSGDGSVSDFDWGRRIVVRFKLCRFNQGSALTADDEAAILLGVPYNRTTTGPLGSKGIGVQVAGTAVTAVVHDGSTGQSVALGTLGNGEIAEIVLDYDGAGTLKASMSGETAEVTRTGGPTGLSTANENSVLAAAWNTTGGTAIPNYSLRDFEIAYY